MSATLTPGRLRLLGALTFFAVAALAAPTAQAAGTTSAVCTAHFIATINPGFTMTPSSGTVAGGGPTGSLTCVGEIGGDRVRGPGSIQIDYTYVGATCLAHVGRGTARWTIPTTAGIKHLVGALIVRRIGLVVLAKVGFPGASASPTGAVVPIQGTCFVTPLRRILVSVSGVLSGA